MGYCSRSRAAALIRAWRVTRNGRTYRDPDIPVQISHNGIEVDGSPITKASPIYLVMNKPRGVLTTASDEKERRTVYDLLEPGSPWVGPVGRLDKASEGLLLLTNDSEWAAKITAPTSNLDKTYHVQVGAVADGELVQALARGVKAKDGEVLRAKQARRLRAGEKNCWLEIILDEGKNRQIRRMIEAVDIEVLR